MEIDLNKFKLDKNKESLLEDEISYLNTLSQNEIKDLINYCDKQYNYYNAMQNALKLILNSVYGAFGNEFFVCSTKEIAGAITAMGRDIIKYMDHINETYWYDF
jgi:DNA polymerase elongation subunit (family B)